MQEGRFRELNTRRVESFRDFAGMFASATDWYSSGAGRGKLPADLCDEIPSKVSSIRLAVIHLGLRKNSRIIVD